MKNLLKKSLDAIKAVFIASRSILISIIAIFFSIGIIYFFILIGWKGLLGFAVGVLMTGFVFMSDNTFIQVYREMILKNHK